MIDRVRKIRFFFITYLLLFGLGVGYFIFNDHGDLVLSFNGLHVPFFNFFFKYWTYTGDWLFASMVVLIVLFFRFKDGLVLGMVLIVQGLLIALFKQLLFRDVPRPKTYFEGARVLDLIEGVKIQDFDSFPSGHTMTAFAMVGFLALVSQSNKKALTLLSAAVLTGISRIYLGHHFLIDILAGSLIGLFVALLFYFLFERYLNNEGRVKDEEPDQDLNNMDLDTTNVVEDAH